LICGNNVEKIAVRKIACCRRGLPDVYLVPVHEPYRAPEHPVPINATIMHKLSLLHPKVPQPDGE
jgi:hypothetical protein